MPAVLFGSISTLADTSELQRQAFNDAFAEHGLGWRWEVDEYRSMLAAAGGRDRVAAYAHGRREDVDADAVHATKSARFREALAGGTLDARPGVVDTLKGARDRGWRVGLVTTTSPDNVAALLASLAPTVAVGDFDVVLDATSVSRPKPDGDVYRTALGRLAESAPACVAIEDNVDGVAAAAAAAVACVAFPNTNTAGHDFSAATRRVQVLDLDELLAIPLAR